MVKNKEDLKKVNEIDTTLSIKISIIIVFALGIILFSISYKTGETLISFLFGILVAFVSLFIALGANINTRKMAQANLYGVVRNLFTSRYTFFRELHTLQLKEDFKNNEVLKGLAKQYMEFATWDCVLCLKQANVLKKWANSENKNKLANNLYILISNVLSQKTNKILKNKHVEHLLLGCNEIIEIGISKKFENNIVEEFEKYSITKKQCTECFQDYIKRKLREVKTDPTGKLKNEDYLELPFMGFK